MEQEKLKPIKFELGEKQLRFQVGRIDLNRFSGKIRGEVEPTDSEYRTVLISINKGLLVHAKKAVDQVEAAPESIDLTSILDDKTAAVGKAAEILKKFQKEELISTIHGVKSTQVIVAMIELESRGKNVSKRKRDEVITALKTRLEQIKAKMRDSGIIEEPSE